MLFSACTSYHVGAVYEPVPSGSTAFGTFLSSDFYTSGEVSLVYVPEKLDKPTETDGSQLGADLTLKIAIPIVGERLIIYPAMGGGLRYINAPSNSLEETFSGGGFFGGGLDINFSPALFLRGKALYMPETFSYNATSGMRFSLAFGYRAKYEYFGWSLFPETRNRYINTAGNAFDEGNYSKALTYYNRALRLDKGNRSARNGKSRVENLQSALKLAKEAQARNDYATAVDNYRKVLNINSKDSEAQRNYKLVWDRRVEENQNLYPASFEGYHYWYNFSSEFVSGISSWSDGTYIYTTHGLSYDVFHHDQYFIIFSGSSYIYEGYYDGNLRQYSTGTFFYNDNTIELENRMVLRVTANGIVDSGKVNDENPTYIRITPEKYETEKKHLLTERIIYHQY